MVRPGGSQSKATSKPGQVPADVLKILSGAQTVIEHTGQRTATPLSRPPSQPGISSRTLIWKERPACCSIEVEISRSVFLARHPMAATWYLARRRGRTMSGCWKTSDRRPQSCRNATAPPRRWFRKWLESFAAISCVTIRTWDAMFCRQPLTVPPEAYCTESHFAESSQNRLLGRL